MEDKITSWFNDLYRKSHALYILANIVAGILLFGSLAAIIAVTVLSYIDSGTSGLSIFGEIFVNTIASIVGVLLAYFLYRFLFLVSHRNEDKNKVSYSNSDMWKQYGTIYRQQFQLHDDSVFTVYCEKLLQRGEFEQLEIDDYPDEFFELDPFIKSQFFTLIEAHAMSNSTNSITVRLKEVVHKKGDKLAVIRTMRSTYLSHMLTNRALDYELKSGVTIRSLFENTNHLIPPQRSRMSNHFGVNALVFLKDGKDKHKWLLLPERGGNATVAKNKVTASIATRITMKDYTKKLQADYVLEGCIKDNIAKSIRVTELPNMEITFLGLSRDIYEGGKPTLFYAVCLDMDKKTYETQRNTYETNKTQERQAKRANAHKGYLPREEESIDEVRKIHIVQWNTIKMGEPCARKIEAKPDSYNTAYDKAQLEFVADGVLEHKAFEQNLIANFWFLQGCPKN